MLRMFAVVCEKVPPAAPRVMTKSVSINVPAAPGFVVRTVPPLRVKVAPAVDDIRSELSVLRVAPEFTVTFPAPTITAPPAIETVPSSIVIPEAVWSGETVTVYALDASPPAEKIALRPDVHAAVAAVPSKTVLQKLLVPHMPVGVAPAPAVAPLLSQ